MSRYMDDDPTVTTTFYRAVIVVKGAQGDVKTRVYGPYLTPGAAKAALNRNYYDRVGEEAWFGVGFDRQVVVSAELRVEKSKAQWAPVVSFWKTEEGE